MILPQFDFIAPKSTEEAIEALDHHMEKAEVLAGGTDLLVNIKRKLIQPEVVIAIDKIDTLKGISDGDHRELKIGSLNTMAAVSQSAAVRQLFPSLAAAAGEMGCVQLRNRATIGGNLCSSRPAADTIGPLIAYGARLRLQGVDNEARRVAMEDFCTGPGMCVMCPNELLTEISLPEPKPNTHSAFIKFGTRKGMEIAIVSITTAVTLDNDGVCESARIVLGAVAPKFIRSPEAEAYLVGKPITPETAAEAGKLAAESAQPITDIRASAEYRVQLVETLTRRCLLQAG